MEEFCQTRHPNTTKVERIPRRTQGILLSQGKGKLDQCIFSVSLIIFS